MLLKQHIINHPQMPVALFLTIKSIWNRKSSLAIMSILFINLLIRNLDINVALAQIKNDGTIAYDDHEISKIFNAYYISVWTDDSGISPDFPRRIPDYTNIIDIVFKSSNAKRA